MSGFAKVGRGVFGAAVLCSLTLGAAQALAAPAQAGSAYSCKPRTCNDDCIASGAQYGYCNYYDYACECVW